MEFKERRGKEGRTKKQIQRLRAGKREIIGWIW
jgi:hypothetical protein